MPPASDLFPMTKAPLVIRRDFARLHSVEEVEGISSACCQSSAANLSVHRISIPSSASRPSRSYPAVKPHRLGGHQLSATEQPTQASRLQRPVLVPTGVFCPVCPVQSLQTTDKNVANRVLEPVEPCTRLPWLTSASWRWSLSSPMMRGNRQPSPRTQLKVRPRSSYFCLVGDGIF